MLSEPVIEGLRERLMYMRRVNSFGRLNDHEMLLVAEHARVRSFADRELALEEGSLEHVHIVASGRFIVTKSGVQIADVDAGGAIGAISAMARDTQGVTARSVGPSVTLEIPIDVFVAVNEESFPVLRVGLRTFSRQLLDTRGHYSLERGDSSRERSDHTAELANIERVIELSERGLFSQWNANALFDVARAATVVRFESGQTPWTAGEPANAAYHVVSGQLVCREPCARGPFGPGAMLGLLEMLSERQYLHTPVARTACVLLHLPFDHLLAALDTHRDLAMALVARMARDLLPAETAALAA